MTANRPIKFIASGFRSPADDFAQQALDLNRFLIKHPASTFFMRNKNPANKKYSIELDDILIIDRSLEPIPSRLNLIIADDEFKVCNYQELQTLLKLKEEGNEFWGVVTTVIRKF